jgi:hypothetical protein
MTLPYSKTYSAIYDSAVKTFSQKVLGFPLRRGQTFLENIFTTLSPDGFSDRLELLVCK